MKNIILTTITILLLMTNLFSFNNSYHNLSNTQSYIPIKTFEINKPFYEENYIFVKNKEYIIGSKGNNITISLYKNQNGKLKLIHRAESIPFKCEDTELYYIDVEVDDFNQENNYKAIIYLVH